MNVKLTPKQRNIVLDWICVFEDHPQYTAVINGINSLVGEDDCVEGFHEWGTCECSNCIKANQQIAKRMIRKVFRDLCVYPEHQPLHQDDIIDWLGKE